LVVRGEIDFLLDRMSKPDVAGRDGDAFGHATAALALAEAYGVEQRTDAHARIRHTLAKRLPVLLSARSAGKEVDPKTLGWLTLALCACHDIGFDVPDDATRATTPAEDILRPPGTPAALDALIKAQSPNGSWSPAASAAGEAPARAYKTATSVLALTTTYKLLPVYAR
jgi:hypothetical protein